MPIDFYQFPASAPCRAVALAAAAVGVEMNFKQVNLMDGDHMTPEYLKMNPQHTIPMIDDNGFYLAESRAIMTYLANQYAKNDTLYPKDPKKRAIVDQRLYFDACNLFKSFLDYFYPMMLDKAPKDQAKFEAVGTAIGFLDKFLEGHNFVAGDNMTLADLSIIATLSTIEVTDYDFSKYKNVSRWYAKMKAEAPKYEECNNVGVKLFKSFVDERLKK